MGETQAPVLFLWHGARVCAARTQVPLLLLFPDTLPPMPTLGELSWAVGSVSQNYILPGDLPHKVA